MNKKGLLLCFILFLYAVLLSATNNQFVVVIDAGHGGKDIGASRGKYKEKDINLAVALELGNLIKRSMKDVKVIYTRDKDVFVDLNDRADVANKAKANLFISIHTNSTKSKNTSVSGADTYILGLAKSEENLAVAQRENSVILLEDDYSAKYEGFDPNSPESYIIFEFMTNKFMEQSLDFASNIQTSFKVKAKRPDRGVRQAGFLVLRRTSMPSVLIELGFINNSTEAAFLASKSGQTKMAEAIFHGFTEYKKNFDKKQGKVMVTQPVNERKQRVIVEDNASVIATPISRPVQTNTSRPKTQVEYRVQILYSDKKLAANSPKFKGLSPVGYYQDNGYKYTYGSTTDIKEIEKLFRHAKTKFKDAFVIQMIDGKRTK